MLKLTWCGTRARWHHDSITRATPEWFSDRRTSTKEKKKGGNTTHAEFKVVIHLTSAISDNNDNIIIMHRKKKKENGYNSARVWCWWDAGRVPPTTLLYSIENKRRRQSRVTRKRVVNQLPTGMITHVTTNFPLLPSLSLSLYRENL